MTAAAEPQARSAIQPLVTTGSIETPAPGGRLRLPFRDRRFWAIVVQVTTIVVVFDSLEARGLLPESGPFYEFPHEFMRDFLFIIPVVYAALNFGRQGALATAAFCTLITIPNWLFLHHGDDREGAMSQMVMIYAIALLVGSRVERETAARTTAESALRALHVSSAKYRTLFESAGEGILLVGARGQIVECNDAAAELMNRPAGEIVGQPADGVLPSDLASALEARATESGKPRDLALERQDGPEVWVEPICTPLPGPEGLTQVVLRDVTERKHRQASLEAYAARVLHAQEEERRRIGQELHDDTVQALVLLCRRIDAMEEQATATDREELHRLRTDVESTVESLRVVLHGLRPLILDDLGLTPAVRQLVAQLAARSEIDVALVVTGHERRLPPDRELTLYRIAQEALRNMERHSAAAHGTVVLRHGSRWVELRVTDDGRGFLMPRALEGVSADGRLGLLGMQERARLVGGTLTLRSSPGAGTTVIATVPADRADA